MDSRERYVLQDWGINHRLSAPSSQTFDPLCANPHMVDPSLVEVLPNQLVLFPKRKRQTEENSVFHRLHPLVFGLCTLGYNEFDFFLENEKHRPVDGCKI
jgi:hypothetical protein